MGRFLAFFEVAKHTPQIPEPTGMILSTVGDDGRPSSRVVLLKSADEEGLVFYTNLESRKGREALAHPVALLFWWYPLEAQVRFEGPAQRVTDEDADAYFATRPRGSQLGAWASAQSRPLASREELEARLAELTERVEGMAGPGPPARPAGGGGGAPPGADGAVRGDAGAAPAALVRASGTPARRRVLEEPR